MIKKTFKKNNQNGQVIIVNILFFLAIASLIVLGISSPVLSSYKISKAFSHSKQSFLLANSATNEAVYKLKKNLEIASSENLSLSQGTATISIADSSGEKVINVNSVSDSYERNIRVVMIEDVGVSFNYGIQAGKGGFEMSGGAAINGNVYSNGPILGSGSPSITGSAFVANRSNPSADQSNSGDLNNPPYNLDFGANYTTQDAAQSFEASTTTPVTSFRFYIKKSTNEWMNNVTLRVTTNNNGKPSKTTLATGTISAQQVTTNFNYLTVPLSSALNLTPGQTYWLVFDTGTSWVGHYSLASTLNTYANGLAKGGTWSSGGSGGGGGTWNDTNPVGLDIYFDSYVGGETGVIDGMLIGTSGEGDAWAHTVNDTNVTGNLYCQASNNNNKACDTSRPDPVEMPFPVSEGNILDWKSIAEAGEIINQNVSYGGSDQAFLGPAKINGNLSVGSGATLNITGTIWVTGNVSISGGALIKLAPNYGNKSGIIVTDGQISATGGGQIQGSGQAGSYMLAVTTSECPDTAGCGNNPAIRVTGGTGSVVLNAQQGTIRFTGGASAKQATAYKITMSGGTTVDYESGLSNIEFTSGPSGGWNIISWDEIE